MKNDDLYNYFVKFFIYLKSFDLEKSFCVLM